MTSDCISFGNSGVNRPSPHGRSGSLAIAWLSTPMMSVDDQVDRLVGVGAGAELPGRDGIGERGSLQVDHLNAGAKRLG